MADAADFYSFRLATTGSATSKIVATFTHASGDLDIAIYNSSNRIVASSIGVTGTETVSLNGLASGTYTLKVYGYRGAFNANYSLAITPPSGTTPSLPDLVGNAISISPNATTWGSTVLVQSAVRTTAEQRAFKVQWYLSTDTTFSTNDILLSTTNGITAANISGLAAGATTASFSSVLKLPASLPPTFSGTSFYIVLRTDSGNTVAESNESNNGGQLGKNIDWSSITVNTSTTNPGSPSSGFSITLNLTGLSVVQQQIFLQAAARWSQAIIGDLANATYNGVVVDDVLIDASAVAIDGPGAILGQAGPDAFRAGSFLPYHGVMEFDSADLAELQAEGTLLSVILHEMGHVLGIGTIWDNKGFLVGAGSGNSRFTGPGATAAYNQLYGVSATGIPLENTGGGGTADSHWRETVFGNELMTGYANPGNNPMSVVTIASLGDLGYVVNLGAAESFVPTAAQKAAAAALAIRASGVVGVQAAALQAARDKVYITGGFGSSGLRTNSNSANSALENSAPLSFNRSTSLLGASLGGNQSSQAVASRSSQQQLFAATLTWSSESSAASLLSNRGLRLDHAEQTVRDSVFADELLTAL